MASDDKNFDERIDALEKRSSELEGLKGRLHQLEEAATGARDRYAEISAVHTAALFREDAGKHREFLQSSLRWITACIGALVLVATGAGAVIFGKSVDAAAKGVMREEHVRKRINEKISESVERDVPSRVNDEITNVLPEKAEKAVDDALGAKAESAFQDAANKQLARMKTLSDDEVQSRLLTLVPVGSVLAWPGRLPVKGHPLYQRWRECDGSEVEFNTLLWGALRGLYGNSGAATADSINLPDFRGMFLRGAGGEAEHVSADIGERQTDQIKRHRHSLKLGDIVGKADIANGGGFGVIATIINNFQTGTVGGDETRPVNHAVHWIIRVK